jgi:hypothetical protein
MPLQIRPATVNDLDRILELGKQFGHQMLYQKDHDVMQTCIPRILVAEEDQICDTLESHKVVSESRKVVVGYYHYIVSGDPGFEEMLTCWRQFPDVLVTEADFYGNGKLCICMQGGSHREVFRQFIEYLQTRYPEIWCYCSKASARPDSYTNLGFTFGPEEEYLFFNCNKGGESTYRLGRWSKH